VLITKSGAFHSSVAFVKGGASPPIARERAEGAPVIPPISPRAVDKLFTSVQLVPFQNSVRLQSQK
jgi:hypothetical protein